jgi:hypothetical protein
MNYKFVLQKAAIISMELIQETLFVGCKLVGLYAEVLGAMVGATIAAVVGIIFAVQFPIEASLIASGKLTTAAMQFLVGLAGGIALAMLLFSFVTRLMIEAVVPDDNDWPHDRLWNFIERNFDALLDRIMPPRKKREIQK